MVLTIYKQRFLSTNKRFMLSFDTCVTAVCFPATYTSDTTEQYPTHFQYVQGPVTWQCVQPKSSRGGQTEAYKCSVSKRSISPGTN